MPTILNIAIATIIVYTIIYLVVIFYFNNKKEGFVNFPHNSMPSGEFPLAVDKPILYGDYNIKTPPYLSAFNASDIYTDYPIYPAHSTKINNIRYWTKPENGTCSRAELCGYFYDNYTQQPIQSPLPTPGWNNRINYYEENYN